MDKNKDVIYNFSAGPAMLPKEILKTAQLGLCNWQNSGKSILEISHRSKEFTSVIESLEYNLRDLLNVPKYYKVLFCHGGARGQFSAIPMNLLKNNGRNPDYINSGYWSYSAALESRKYCVPNIINVRKILNGNHCVCSIKNWEINTNNTYLHYCPNETIEGIAIYEEPYFKDDIIVVGDFSSTLFSRIIDITRYGIIYASAQKNVGPPGVTIVIVHEDLLKEPKIVCPSILNYNILSKSNSMFNTPATFSLYISGLVLEWMKKLGGLKTIQKSNEKKANLLYNMIDSTDFYINNVMNHNRSFMNVTFTIANSNLHSLFLKESYDFGLHCLNGHNVIGGLRASIYNAMPIEGVMKLIKFMKIFEKKYE
ncbi:MAG: 3-phosphoserine/phosphohydroxythreonine transaminase [Buchnera aphidicola (Meitanaphis elongallis)]